MVDARRSVHVDDPASPKKALLPNLQRPPLSFSAVLDLVAEYLPGLRRPGAASDYRNKVGRFHQDASLC